MKVHELIPGERPICCKPGDTAQQAARLMKVHDIGSLPVCDESKRLLGIVTDRDLCVRLIAEGKPPTTRIEECMTRGRIATVSRGDDVARAEELMKEHQVRRIPIVDEGGTLVGILAQADLARRAEPATVKDVVAEISQPKEKQAA